MDSTTAEERSIHEGLRKKLDDVNSLANSHLAPVQDHIHFMLQKAYFKCAYDCFDRRMKQEDISNCVEHCSVPVLTAQNLVENEMARFQESLGRALRVCQDKYESAKLQPNSKNAVKDLESCVDLSVQDAAYTIPHLARKLKAQLSIDE